MLTEEDKAMLELAGANYKYPAVKEQHAQDRFGISGVRYWQRVNQLLDHPAAVVHAPMLVQRLRSRRVSRGVR